MKQKMKPLGSNVRCGSSLVSTTLFTNSYARYKTRRHPLICDAKPTNLLKVVDVEPPDVKLDTSLSCSKYACETVSKLEFAKMQFVDCRFGAGCARVNCCYRHHADEKKKYPLTSDGLLLCVKIYSTGASIDVTTDKLLTNAMKIGTVINATVVKPKGNHKLQTFILEYVTIENAEKFLDHVHAGKKTYGVECKAKIQSVSQLRIHPSQYKYYDTSQMSHNVPKLSVDAPTTDSDGFTVVTRKAKSVPLRDNTQQRKAWVPIPTVSKKIVRISPVMSVADDSDSSKSLRCDEMSQLEIENTEQRLAPDGCPYTRTEFVKYFGGIEEWMEAKPENIMVEFGDTGSPTPPPPLSLWGSSSASSSLSESKAMVEQVMNRLHGPDVTKQVMLSTFGIEQNIDEDDSGDLVLEDQPHEADDDDSSELVLEDQPDESSDDDYADEVTLEHNLEADATAGNHLFVDKEIVQNMQIQAETYEQNTVRTSRIRFLTPVSDSNFPPLSEGGKTRIESSPNSVQDLHQSFNRSHREFFVAHCILC